ncbi:TlpA disulfide reductase family protein [Curvibacter sp. APW13]|uniref:TlpA family protein disulfide reductase n=1 Tax=Curvibacter sp. APW13 TaxID=3077236 RepID=UPI0028DF98B2|nr:TlpA disulfide reductase family protein [Curvibacter sp. APW13]MDT8992499.1 TlpA disulfide reductase family protein [Curvibacter sp. APW13]
MSIFPWNPMPLAARSRSVALTLFLHATFSVAQPVPANIPMARLGDTLQWQARAMDDGVVHARTAQGKVSVVFVWSTACAVCRSTLPELRANAAGWSHKPFQLVTLNVDAHRADWQGYEQLVARSTTLPPNMRAYWMGSLTANARLPLTLVLDAQGRVVARHEGRMAPQAWDTVAELLL